MGRINGWKRLHHYETLAEAEENLDSDGRVRLAAWIHDDAGRLEYVYEPSAERPFIVQLTDAPREFPEEGRYEYRTEGGSANKALMRKYP